jgi:hypothetical protein
MMSFRGEVRSQAPENRRRRLMKLNKKIKEGMLKLRTDEEGYGGVADV